MSPERIDDELDLVVLGGGTAGLVTASGCARLGRKVALIEKEALGGECLWTGCVPTKALVASARLAYAMRNADRYGLASVEPAIQPAAILEAMRETQRITQKHDDPEKFRRLGIDVIFGEGRFLSSRVVEVGGRRLRAKDVVIATGSRTRVPEIDGLHETGFLDHATFLAQQSFPRSVVIVGGGAVATEFAQIFRRFGAAVTLLQRSGEILRREDASIRRAVLMKLRGEGIDVRLDCSPVRARRGGAGAIITTRNSGGEEREISAETIFIATGRRGNIESLNLEAAGVRTSNDFVTTDRWLRTSAPRVWACGDVHGDLLFTHVAAYEAVKLVRNILFPGRSAVDYSNIPWAIFTDPEVARVGMTLEDAERALGKTRVRAWRVEMSEVDRAVADRTTEGFIEIVTDTKGRMLGAHAFCAQASTLIEVIVMARSRNAKIGDLARIVSPYPSLSDAIGKVASLYYQDLASGRLGGLARRVARWTQR